MTEMVTYKSNNYVSLISIDAATVALAPTEFEETWNALSDEDKAKRLITTTRFIRSYQSWNRLQGTEPGVAVAVARLAMATTEDGTQFTDVTAGPISLSYKATSEVDLIDQVARRLLDVAARGIGGQFGATNTPNRPATSFDGFFNP